ncbi:MAG: tyrosine--tRNA ligase, partial [Actinobacteria bacterium]|nr:tyrosine--tRNA ligase [Actinomycetota bacterium]
PISAYIGFDCTANSLHVGSLLPIMGLARMQRFGHTPIALVGGGTGLIGDPSGKTAERQLLTKEKVAENIEGIRAQLSHFLDFERNGNPARIENNHDWLGSLQLIDFLRDTGKHFTVNYMLSKESVKRRIESEDGISYTEFSYQILQGMDFLRLYETYNCVLQTGGSDQWGNLTSGTDLVHKALGVSVHALGTPLITNSDGTKFGKSEGNAVWLDSELTSPYALFQFWLNTDDRDVIDRLKVFTFLTRAEIEELEAAVADTPHLRAAQKRLAEEVTTIVHGPDQTQAVKEASEALFGKGELEGLDPATLESALRELPHATVTAETTVAQALVDTGLCQSLSEARRAIAQGGVSINNQGIEDDGALVGAPRAPLPAGVVLKRGKKTLAGLFYA